MQHFSNAGYTGRTGVIQTYTIPVTGNYLIEAGGARGGKHVTNYGSYPGYGSALKFSCFDLVRSGVASLYQIRSN